VLSTVTDGQPGSTLVAVHVRDVNDNRPVFTRSTYNVTWSVGMATQALAVVKATDEDSGICGQVLYTISAGNDQRLFTVDVYSGTNHDIMYSDIRL